MSENLVVNDVTYPGVDALMMVNEKGEQVPFYPDAVRYNQQTLTEEQKAQARENVGALSSGDVSSVLQQAKDSGDFKGDTGRRGTGLLPVTTAPSAYTTAVNGLTPAYRIALSTVKSQASATEVFAGDTVRYSYYHYPVIYVDSSYVYCGARVSIRGETGAAGTTPVKGTDYWTLADQEAIVQQVITALGTPVFGRVDADNNIILTGTLGEGTYTFKYEDAEGNVTTIGTITNEPEPELGDIPITWIKNVKIDKTTGVGAADANGQYCTCETIELDENGTYAVTVTNRFEGDLDVNYCYYDGDGKFVGYVLSERLTTETLAPPAGAKGLKLRVWVGSGTQYQNTYLAAISLARTA